MKTKLVAILMILLFSGIFTACTEEEIAPQANNKTTVKQTSTIIETDNF